MDLDKAKYNVTLLISRKEHSASQHPFAQGPIAGKCLICEQERDLHDTFVSPRVQRLIKSEVERAALREKRMAKSNQMNTEGEVQVEEEEEEEEEYTKTRERKKQDKLLVLVKKGTVQARAQKKVENLSKRFRLKKNSGARRKNSTTSTVATESEDPHGIEVGVFLNFEIRFAEKACLWAVEDVLNALGIFGQERSYLTQKVLEEGRDMVQRETIKFLTENGLYTVILKKRTQKALSLHAWCMEVRESMVQVQSGSSVSRKKKKKRDMSLISVNDPVRVITDAREALRWRVSDQCNIWRQCGFTRERRFPIYTKDFSLSESESFLHVKSKCEFDLPPEAVFRFVSNSSFWTSWDPCIAQVTPLFKVEGDIQLLHATMHAFVPLEQETVGSKVLPSSCTKPRDLCLLWHSHRQFREYVVTLHSTMSSDCPQDRKNFVRGKIRSSGFVIGPVVSSDGVINDRRTEFCMVFLIDMNGKLPSFLESFIIQEKSACMDKLFDLITRTIG